MKTQPEHRVEPLSDTTWQRIEASLFERLAAQPTRPVGRAPASRRRGALTGSLAAAVALLATWSALHRPSATPPRTAVQHLRTGQAPQTFSLPGVSLHLAPHTVLDCDGARCQLALGDALFEVAPRRGRAPFVVVAGEVSVEVVGTRFRVVRQPDATSVETYEGTVRVDAPGEQQLLQRGQRWPAPRAAIPLDASAPPAETQPVAPARGPGPRARFEEAAASEATDARRAAQLYEQLAQETGPWASNGLFALGRLELERGQATRAERHLRRYLQLYPHGANALDAQALLARIARRMSGSGPGL